MRLLAYLVGVRHRVPAAAQRRRGGDVTVTAGHGGSCSTARPLRGRGGAAGLAVVALLGAGCASGPALPAAGWVAGQRVATTVDSELARYYLEHRAAGRRLDTKLDRALDEALAGPVDPADGDALARLSRRTSPDLATLYFVARLHEMPANGRAQDAFHEALRALRAGAWPRSGPGADRSHLFAFVPGYAYRKDPSTGADFARQRRLLADHGLATVLIETDELGRVEDNAAIVARELGRLVRRHERIIVVSTSKGGPEAALALGALLPAAALAHVRAWISVGGLLRGTPYADSWTRWPWSWLARLAFAYEGLRPEAIPDLSAAVRRPAFDRVRLPPHLLAVQYVGVPLSGHIHRAVAGRYEALRPFGPNDGLGLLADQLVPGGLAITDIGLDHYYLDPAIDVKALALAVVVLEELQRQAIVQCAPARRVRGPGRSAP